MPKAVSGIPREVPVFKCFVFKGMGLACSGLWNCEELGGSRQLHFYLQRYNEAGDYGDLLTLEGPAADGQRRYRMPQHGYLARRSAGTRYLWDAFVPSPSALRRSRRQSERSRLHGP